MIPLLGSVFYPVITHLILIITTRMLNLPLMECHLINRDHHLLNKNKECLPFEFFQMTIEHTNIK